MPHGIKGWAVWVAGQTALIFVFHWILKLADNAMLTWVDNQIAGSLGISQPQISTVMSWAIPACLGFAILWIYHIVQTRISKAENMPVFSDRAAAQKPPAMRATPSQPARRKQVRMTIALLGMVICGIGFIAFATWYAFERTAKQVITSEPSILPRTTTQSTATIKQIPNADRERLDLALYEIFDAISKLAIPPYNDARYITGNWESKLMGATERHDFLTEMHRIRADYVKFIERMQSIMFKDYYYYRDELRDEILRGGAPDLHGAIDRLQIAIQALPQAPVGLITVRLIDPQVDEFNKSVETVGHWIADTQELIRNKRNELAQTQPR